MKMNIQDQFLKQAVHNLVESYELGLAFMKTIELKCNECMGVQFVERNIGTIRSNERLINLNGSILEESLKLSKAFTEDEGLAIIRGSTQSIEPERSHVNVAIVDNVAAGSNGGDGSVQAVEDSKQGVVADAEREYCTVQSVDLTEKHVSFSKTVTIVNYSKEKEKIKKRASSGTKLPKSTKKSISKKPKSIVAAQFAQKIRDGIITFKKKSNLTSGLCAFCNKRKSLSKFLWQKHLLTHTGEQFYSCRECGSSFSQRSDHTNCVKDSTVNIYDRYTCSGDGYLAAFLCNICDHAQVSERNMETHLRTEHDCHGEEKQFYQKCKFVTNVH